MLPTVTPIGMTALLPLSGADMGLQMKANNLHPTVNGKDTAVLSNRIAYLEGFGATCLDIADAEAAREAPPGAGELLVVFGHNDVDHIGHGEAQTKACPQSLPHYVIEKQDLSVSSPVSTDGASIIRQEPPGSRVPLCG